jgi:hypothetical protein
MELQGRKILEFYYYNNFLIKMLLSSLLSAIYAKIYSKICKLIPVTDYGGL